jgi:hypothetical protein
MLVLLLRMVERGQEDLFMSLLGMKRCLVVLMKMSL